MKNLKNTLLMAAAITMLPLANAHAGGNWWDAAWSNPASNYWKIENEKDRTRKVEKNTNKSISALQNSIGKASHGERAFKGGYVHGPNLHGRPLWKLTEIREGVWRDSNGTIGNDNYARARMEQSRFQSSGHSWGTRASGAVEATGLHADIEQNSSDIIQNSSDINHNLLNIEQNSSDIIQNSSDINHNLLNIEQNSTSIENEIATARKNEDTLLGNDRILDHRVNQEARRATVAERGLGRRIDSIGASDERLKEFNTDIEGRRIWKYNKNADETTTGGIIDGVWHRGKTAQEWQEIDSSYVTNIGDTEYLKVETLAIVGDHQDRITSNTNNIQRLNLDLDHLKDLHYKGMSMQAATGSLVYGKKGLAIGVGGNINGAFAVSAGYLNRENNIKLTVSSDLTDQVQFGAGIGW